MLAKSYFERKRRQKGLGVILNATNYGRSFMGDRVPASDAARPWEWGRHAYRWLASGERVSEIVLVLCVGELRQMCYEGCSCLWMNEIVELCQVGGRARKSGGWAGATWKHETSEKHELLLMEGSEANLQAQVTPR